MYQSFELLKKIYFVRTSGSKEETKAAEILKDEVLSLGCSDVKIEEFEVDGADIKKASVKFLNPDIEVECCGVGQSSSTPEDGLTADFVFIPSLEDAEQIDVKGKICMVIGKLVNYKLYKKLVEKGAIALVLTTGSVYDEKENVDLDPYMYRPRHYENGKIPAVCIRMRDAEEILRANPKQVHLTMIEDEFKTNSRNVVATIEGSVHPEEIVTFTAHYDSVSYSKGAYDNGTGSTCIMQVLAYFLEHKPERTLKFIWCGSEEVGLEGSKAWCRDHEDEVAKTRLNVNVDMIGVTIGHDIAVATASNELVASIKYFGRINGFPIESRQGVYSSDSSPFADKGVPAISFARISGQGGAVIHSRKDVIDWLSEDNYYKTCDFIAKYSETLINSKVFPVDKEIPEKMKEELDYYFGRKERK